MQYNERLDAELKALEGDMIETLQRWIRVPSVRAERSADNAPFGENVRRALGLEQEELMRRLLEAHVKVNDGLFFGEGGRGFIRLNIGCPRAQLNAALERMKDVLN